MRRTGEKRNSVHFNKDTFHIFCVKTQWYFQKCWHTNIENVKTNNIIHAPVFESIWADNRHPF